MTEKPIQSLSGTEDRLPWQWGLWHRLHSAARRQFGLYGYGELATPVIEDARLFIKGTGADTEIVEKQMYTIPSRGDDADTGEAVTLRPEGTPPAVRAYLESDLHKKQKFQKLWYAGPMFRRERPQKGRLRQFHQIGVEAIGGESHLLDAETILLADAIYRDAGIGNHRIHLNTIGCAQCRPEYRSRLRERLQKRRSDLCEDCIKRLNRNVMRILDCKNEMCRRIAADLPDIKGMVCSACGEHHHNLLAILDGLDVSYLEDPLLVRGLDYYSRTVYEIKHDALGARDTVCGGGRYDGLVEQLGGPETPCVGFAMGVEATLIAMEAEVKSTEDPPGGVDAYVICFEESARSRCFHLLTALRAAGLQADMDFERRSARAQMKMANRSGASFCLLIGEQELEQRRVTLKDMGSGDQWSADWDGAASEILKKSR